MMAVALCVPILIVCPIIGALLILCLFAPDKET